MGSEIMDSYGNDFAHGEDGLGWGSAREADHAARLDLHMWLGAAKRCVDLFYLPGQSRQFIALREPPHP